MNPNQLDHWDFFETRTSRLFDYIAIFNRLFVIASAMKEPLVDSTWPSYDFFTHLHRYAVIVLGR
jgi:hypothetical protein